KIDPHTITAALALFEQEGLFDCASLRQHPLPPPDCSFKVILLRSGTKELMMQSWHEECGETPTTVTLSLGVWPRIDLNPGETLARGPASYLPFGVIWCERRQGVNRLTPASGEPIDGELVMEGDVRYWREP